MCVILVGHADKILEFHAQKAMDANPHGAGIAWLDTLGGSRTVRFVKGLEDEPAKSLLSSLGSRQVIFHARIATVGGSVPSLTHPFPIEINPSIALEGTSDLVLFHNGHMTDWETLRGTIHDELPWSDSRAIAHGLAIGTVSNLLDPKVRGSKFVMFSPKFLGHYPKSGWTHVKGAVLASNRDFLSPIIYTYNGTHNMYDDEYDSFNGHSISSKGWGGHYRGSDVGPHGLAKCEPEKTSAESKWDAWDKAMLRRKVRAAMSGKSFSDRLEIRERILREGGYFEEDPDYPYTYRFRPIRSEDILGFDDNDYERQQSLPLASSRYDCSGHESDSDEDADAIELERREGDCY